ncbi:MAG: non-homologous end-joining DNA ligase [archaeon]
MSKRLTKVKLTNLDKILYPKLGVTKAQVIEYYIRIAPKMLPLLADRPLVLTRFPDGVDHEGFYEKDAPIGSPSWVETFRRYSKTSQRDIDYVVCNNLDTIIWLANLAALEIHVFLSRTNVFGKPDLALVGIDPEPPATFHDAVSVALLVKGRLDARRVRSYVKTSGKKGLHMVIPIAQKHSFRQVRECVRKIAIDLAKENTLVVAEASKSQNPGTVFIDYPQNSIGRTMASPYSLRGVPDATVSTPIEWKDLNEKLNPEELNIFNVPKSRAEPWKGMLENVQKREVK